MLDIGGLWERKGGCLAISNPDGLCADELTIGCVVRAPGVQELELPVKESSAPSAPSTPLSTSVTS